MKRSLTPLCFYAFLKCEICSSDQMSMRHFTLSLVQVQPRFMLLAISQANAFFSVIHFPSCIAILVGSLVQWLGLLSHHKQTASEFLSNWAETTSFRPCSYMSKQSEPMEKMHQVLKQRRFHVKPPSVYFS